MLHVFVAHLVDGTNLIIDRSLLTWLPQLHHLEMSNMSLVDSNLKSLTPSNPYPSLISLVLRTNNLSSVPKGLLGKLQSLEVLDLSNNEIFMLSGEDFKHSSRLLMLDLSENDISIISESTFSNLEHLSELNLNDNNLTTLSMSVFPQHFEYMPDLTVYLSSNPWRCKCENCVLIHLMWTSVEGYHTPFNYYEATHFKPCKFGDLLLVDYYCASKMCHLMENRETLMEQLGHDFG